MDKELLRQRPFYLNDEEIDWVYKTLGELTEDEKIGQLFCVNIREGSIEELDHFLILCLMAVLCTDRWKQNPRLNYLII